MYSPLLTYTLRLNMVFLWLVTHLPLPISLLPVFAQFWCHTKQHSLFRSVLLLEHQLSFKEFPQDPELHFVH